MWPPSAVKLWPNWPADEVGNTRHSVTYACHEGDRNWGWTRTDRIRKDVFGSDKSHLDDGLVGHTDHDCGKRLAEVEGDIWS